MSSHKNFSLTNNQIGEMINPLSSANVINLTSSATGGGAFTAAGVIRTILYYEVFYETI